MYDKPFIGINLDLGGDDADSADPSLLLLERWLDCIERCGGIPLIVRLSTDDLDLSRILDRLDGFVLTGLRDAPVTRAEAAWRNTPAVPELLLVRSIAERRLPFLGIGLGMQALALFLGGTLFHLEDAPQLQAAQRHPHHPRHLLWTSPGSLVERLYGNGRTMVNSAHQLAVREVPSGLVATGRCTAGVIEAVETEGDDWFAVGVQFQPEPDWTADLDLRLFEAFLDEVLAVSASELSAADTPQWTAP
jgi:putative glutamine amidotransferase